MSVAVEDELWSAVADPTRRRLLDALLAHGEATATTLARDAPVTRQAVAKHLAALRAAELVRAARVGRETRYTLEPRPLGDAARWIARVGGEWDERLGDLGRLLGSGRRD